MIIIKPYCDLCVRSMWLFKVGATCYGTFQTEIRKIKKRRKSVTYASLRYGTVNKMDVDISFTSPRPPHDGAKLIGTVGTIILATQVPIIGL